MMDLWAHSRNGAGARHRLEDHLCGTAERARSFGEPFGAAELVAYLGLVHDVGKGSCAWQAGLVSAEQTGARVGIPHKQAGTWLAQRAAGPFALCVYGHHGGLPAAGDLKGILRGASAETVADWEATAADVAEMVPQIIQPAPSRLYAGVLGSARRPDNSVLELLVRMVFSALVDADFLDTEARAAPVIVRVEQARRRADYKQQSRTSPAALPAPASAHRPLPAVTPGLPGHHAAGTRPSVPGELSVRDRRSTVP